MKILNGLLISFMFIFFIIFIGCTGENIPDVTLHFKPEYDCISGYDIFPGQDFDYVANVFDDANTVFSPYFSDTYIATGYPWTVEQLYDFVDDHADCFKDDSGNCVELSDGVNSFNKLEKKLYLASLINYEDNSLGGTLNDGEAHKAICFIFFDHIVALADNPLVTEDFEQIRNGTVIHELGHGRADLPHLCYDDDPYDSDYSEDDVDYDNHDFTNLDVCIMANTFPRPDCLESNDESPLYSIHFCNKCKNKLKAVQW